MSCRHEGIAGDWKNHFTREACQVFARHGGEALIALGYEEDDAWIEEQADRIGASG